MNGSTSGLKDPFLRFGLRPGQLIYDTEAFGQLIGGLLELRKLAFAETAPATKIPEQTPLELADATEDNEEV